MVLTLNLKGDGKFINPTVLLTVADDNINFAFIGLIPNLHQLN